MPYPCLIPRLLRAAGDDRAEILLVVYPDSPRYEVRVYLAAVPHDHRTIIATDSIAEAEATYRRGVAQL